MGLDHVRDWLQKLMVYWIFEESETMTQKRIVCSAIRVNGRIICGVRHFDRIMQDTLALIPVANNSDVVEQGFVDQHGDFLTREEAHDIAAKAGQILHRCGGDKGKLYSENLY